MIKIGIIGAGHIAHKFAKAVTRSKLDATLDAIASRSEKKAVAFQNQFDIKKAYNSYEKLYQDPEIDLVYIATPHTFHYDQMMMALDYNKHIICEKPFTINAELAEQVFQKAQEKKCFVMEAMWTRFLPAIIELKKDIDDGIIGNINHLEADFCFNPSNPPTHRLYQPHLGGGALLDVGIYPITFANLFLGQPTNIQSDVKMMDTGVDAKETLTYEYPESTTILRAAIIEERPLVAIIKGEKGFAVVEGLHDTESIKIFNTEKELIKHIHHPHETNGFEYEIKEAIRCIQKGLLETPILPHEETLSVLNQMDGLRKEWNLIYPQEQ